MYFHVNGKSILKAQLIANGVYDVIIKFSCDNFLELSKGKCIHICTKGLVNVHLIIPG